MVTVNNAEEREGKKQGSKNSVGVSWNAWDLVSTLKKNKMSI